MKFLTIKTRITLWYTFFMIVLVTIMLSILVQYSSTTILTNQTEKLAEIVEETIEDIMDGETIDFFEDGVYLLQYNKQQEYVTGSIPIDFPVDFKLKEGQLQKIEEKERIFYIYDREIVGPTGQMMWIRGIISNTKENQLSHIVVGITFILFPILVILSSMTGYFITKRAFNPVRKIQETAQKITESGELSMRIGLPKGKDEIFKLGQTIDGMLEQLEQSFKKEKQFTSDASHELRTPIAVILNESEYMLQHVTDIEEARESMEVINRQANKITKLINQLLFFARADEEIIQLDYKWIDVQKLIQELIEDRRLLNDTNVTVTMIDERLNKRNYLIDEMLFIRAVQNLIQNAITYGKPNGHVEIRIFEEANYFGVEVKDDGIGINAQDLPQIWNRFYQVDKARSRQNSGSMGLGLSMVKWITEKHGGYVKAESVLNEGSKFTLYFPIKIKCI